ncbi:hypothetical protein Taro_003588 [Colocasia esculenta]|uniref:Uncharacterized protein n=1 Tax=Colocasia esculenta TaxID=4460 RepID=A0A843TM19_COLES|nr:hypothetical protein [Colocasia esculenta]
MSIRSLGSKCVDTIGHYVDTTGIVFKLGFWDSDLVSTPQGTVSTPQSTSVDTQVDCVDTTVTNLCKPENRMRKPLIQDIIIKM